MINIGFRWPEKDGFPLWGSHIKKKKKKNIYIYIYLSVLISNKNFRGQKSVVKFFVDVCQTFIVNSLGQGPPYENRQIITNKRLK